MGGVVGRLFNEFGMVVTLAIMASALVSLTVTPMLASRLSSHSSRPPAIIRWFNAGFDRTLASMTGPSGGACVIAALFLLCFLGLCSRIGLLFWTLPSSFFPQEDMATIGLDPRREDISYAAMNDLQNQVPAAIRANPAVLHVTSIVGGNSRSPLNNGSCSCS